jgi:hypothetical protein
MKIRREAVKFQVLYQSKDRCYAITLSVAVLEEARNQHLGERRLADIVTSVRVYDIPGGSVVSQFSKVACALLLLSKLWDLYPQ